MWNTKPLIMNNNQTIGKLREMRLVAMAQMHENHLENNQYTDHTLDEYIALLTDQEWEYRQNKKMNRMITQAGFRQHASVADIDYKTMRNLDKNLFERLTSLNFISQRENIIITGASGVGKSYLAQALGNQACQMCLKTSYVNTARLFAKLKLCKLDGSYIKELQKLQKNKLLILDDFGLQSFDNHAREALMDIIEDRYDQSATIVVSQIPVGKWYDVIGEGTIADAILDRLINSSHRIELNGESLRKNYMNNKN